MTYRQKTNNKRPIDWNKVIEDVVKIALAIFVGHQV